jgi:hypothetical protein
MKSKNPAEHFEVQSHIGTDIYGFREDGERPPRSAKLVADLDMGSHPGGGDFRKYLLSTNRERSSWILWVEGEDEESSRPHSLYCRAATGRPYRGYPARFAAEQLLIKAWQDERDLWHWVPPEASIMTPGLLSQEDINRIKGIVFGDDKNRP